MSIVKTRLININGNTCYLNSIIYILYNTDIIYNIIINNNISNNNTISSGINELFTLMSDNTGKLIKPMLFLLQFKNAVNNWNIQSQQDSEEFLSLLLTKMNEEYNKESKFKLYNINDTTLISKSKNVYYIHLTSIYEKIVMNEYSIISQNIRYYIKWVKKCSFCNIKTNDMYSNFIIRLSLSKNNITLYDCLDELLLCKKNELTCDFCNLSNHCIMKDLFWKTSNILIISFNRFNNMLQKINTDIEYPLILNLNNYFDKNSPYKEDSLYELFAINVHEGDNIQYGHYISYIKLDNSRWLIYNDHYIKLEDNLICSKPYLLFYKLIK